MKKAILIFIVTLLFTGCLEEDWDDCNSILRLTFKHGNTTEGFDNTIGNDVHAYVYKNNKYHHTVKIPYEDIQGGKEYLLRKTFSGQLSIAAWAVPRTGSQGNIPDSDNQRTFSTSTIGHTDMTRNLSLVTALNDLYLGTLDVNESVLEDTSHDIHMRNTVCRVRVTIEEGLLDGSLSNGSPRVEIGGISRNLTIADLNPSGEEVLVYSDLTKENDKYVTGAVGVMPSYKIDDDKTKTILVTAFCGDTQLFYVDSGQLSVPGTTVDVDIEGTRVVIYVNGYRVKTTSITF